MTRTALALGSNLGDRLAHLRTAVKGIHRLGTVISVSSLYETDAVGGPAQDRYLNAVVVVDTDLPPEELLVAAQALEAEAGRVRTERWGPRTLDVDIVSYGDRVVEGMALRIPHPRASERRFVLDPLVEVAPNTRLSGGVTAREARAATPRGGVLRWEGDWTVSQPRLGARGQALVAVQFVLFLVLVAVALGTATYPIPWWRALPGLVLAITGGGMVIGAVAGLGIHVSALPDALPNAPLVDSGVYRLVRHPIYGGLLLGGAAVGVTLGTVWVLPALVCLFWLFRYKSALEERALGIVHPEYPDYATRVPKRFVPFVL